MSTSIDTQPDTPRVDRQRIGEMTVLRPRGRLDRDLADDVRQFALEAHGPVVIDLDDCALIDPASVQRLAFEWELYRPEMCVVSSRNATRELLHLASVDQELPVFADVDHAADARQASGRWSQTTTG